MTDRKQNALVRYQKTLEHRRGIAIMQFETWAMNNKNATQKEQENAALAILEDADEKLLRKMAAQSLVEYVINSQNLARYAIKMESAYRASEGGKGKAKKLDLAKEEIKKLWAEGNFSTRDRCAEESYSSLGFESLKTARNALQNTPDPNPWPAKQR